MTVMLMIMMTMIDRCLNAAAWFLAQPPHEHKPYRRPRRGRGRSVATLHSLFLLTTVLVLSIGVSTWSMWWTLTHHHHHQQQPTMDLSVQWHGSLLLPATRPISTAQRPTRSRNSDARPLVAEPESPIDSTLQHRSSSTAATVAAAIYSNDTVLQARNEATPAIPSPVPVPVPPPANRATEAFGGTGILSEQDISFFRRIQADTDALDPVQRCRRYGWTHPSVAAADIGAATVSATTAVPVPKMKRRRIFLGGLLAAEPLEVLHIVATETYGIYTGIVFVEGNRTQSFVPRPFGHLTHAPMLAQLFGVPPSHVQVRAFVQEHHKLTLLAREHRQRAEIIQGWHELGMTPDDVGVIADADETWTRDVLRAMETCTDIPQFNYDANTATNNNHHACRHDLVKITAHTRSYESSPECLTSNRGWFHPDAIIGHCIDGIGNRTLHGSAPRDAITSYMRAEGFGKHCSDWGGEDNIARQAHTAASSSAASDSGGGGDFQIARYPLWDAADFRRTCSDKKPLVVLETTMTTMANQTDNLSGNVSASGFRASDTAAFDPYTGFHFHNFFAHMNHTRFKYQTYGHADASAGTKSIANLSEDLQMMYRCVKDIPDPPSSKWQRHLGGWQTIPPFVPIYFHDMDYRRRRHAHVRTMVLIDEASWPIETAEQQNEKAITGTMVLASHDSNMDSSTATVVALATNYDLEVYQRFVGSLRRTGYTGHVILGLQPNPPGDVVHYLHRRNVTIQILSWEQCTYTRGPNETNDIFRKTTCASPYPDLKIRWSRFPLARDWLLECTSCTGPILLTDARDVVFQRDPFGPGSPRVEGLHVFQEDLAVTTENWLTEWPIRVCKNVTFKEPMLCSGTTLGTRTAMLEYLSAMHLEMKVWIEDPKCRFDIHGDDQSIHNYLFYSGKLPFATSIANRRGGIVNTVGYSAGKLFRNYIRPFVVVGNKSVTTRIRYPGANEMTWISVEHNVTNEDGLLIEFDGTVSRVVHQWDRFGFPFYQWLDKQPWIRDAR